MKNNYFTSLTGAYIKFGANSDRYFVQFTAAASKTKKLTFRQQVDNVEKSAIRELKEKLQEQKAQLKKEFKERDPENTGEGKKLFLSKCHINRSHLHTNRSNNTKPVVGSHGICYKFQATLAFAARKTGSG